MDESIVVIDKALKTFPDIPSPAINDVSLKIPSHGVIGLVGPDGSGKTTLIRLMTGLLLPNSGTVTVSGYDTRTESEQISNCIGYMPQKFGLYEDLTVLQNLNLYAALQNVPESEKKGLFDSLLSFTNLHPFTDRRAGKLSGGMKQKLGLACALLRKPPLLLLDEPSVGVDPLSRRELWKMVHALVDEGTTVIWSTSYLDEAASCDTVVLLDVGSVLFFGKPEELTKKADNRVFLLQNISTNKRSILAKAIVQDNVVDGVIQGSSVRIVVKEAKNPPIDFSAFPDDPHLKAVKTPPRFEDAFIELLGGGPKGVSSLAQIMQPFQDGPELVVRAEHLTKKFGTFTAVNDISFNVQKGEIFGLLGPNGAGKSTTFKMLCGLLKPTSGNPLVNDINLQEAPSEGRSFLGYMSQKFSLYSILSVYQNLGFFSGIYDISGKRQKKIIDIMVKIFGLEEYVHETVDDLSLGYKQRLALACAVMHSPRVLFLDEPTSGVDPITRREFWNHINGVVEKGATVVVTTHFMDEAEYCDRIGLVYKSNLIQLGTPDELKASCVTKENPSPTLEEAFISLIEKYEEDHF